MNRPLSFFQTQALAVRFARRDFQGRSGGFWLLVAGLAFAITAFALVGSIADAVLDGVRGGARQAVGGDLALRLFHRPASSEEKTHLKTLGKVSEIAELRPLVQRSDGSRPTLVELKAVDPTYPLLGELRLNPPTSKETAFDLENGFFGAAAAPALLKALGLQVGDIARLGTIDIQIRTVIVSEPDKSLAAFSLGPRLMISRTALDQSGLSEAGGPSYYYSRVLLDAPDKAEAAIAEIEVRFPHAGWRIVNAADGVPGIERMAEIGRSLLILIGLSVLLICGIGVSGGVSAHLTRKTKTIAILKSNGAPRGLISSIYLWQVLFAALLALIIGLIAGAALQQAAMGLAAPYLPFEWQPGLQPLALAVAGAFGLLTALLFAIWPLDRACSTPAQKLFKHQMKPQRDRHTWKAVAIMVLAAGLIGALVMTATAMPLFALIFGGGVALAVLAFLGLGKGVGWLAHRIHFKNRPVLRIAIANIGRPGAPTGSMIMALGLTLTLLVAILTLDRHAGAHLRETLPAQTPDLVFLNIAPEESDAFAETIAVLPGVQRFETAPFLHGRLTAVKDTPVRDWGVPKDISWVVRGDRGLSWRAQPTDKGQIVTGEWWPKDYRGPLQASLDVKVAERLRVTVGDRITLNILGHPTNVTIANLRAVDWTRLELDFPILLSPPPTPIPHSRVAALWATPNSLEAIEKTAQTAFPLSPFIRVPAVLTKMEGLIDGLTTALVMASTATVSAAFFVLAGSLSAGYRRRVKEMALLKVVGARPKQIALSCMLEMLLIALAAAIPSALLGTGAAYGVVAKLMPGGWTFFPEVSVLLILGTGASMAAIGYLLLKRQLNRQIASLRHF